MADQAGDGSPTDAVPADTAQQEGTAESQSSGQPTSTPAPVHGIVIGAMKSGTTTLYHDLRRFPGFDIPAKELDFFQRPAAEVTAAAYRALFQAPEATTTCRLDISTTYAMWPDIPDVAERAADLLGGSARLVYMVRNPIERAVSHHHHMVARGATTATFEQYLSEDPGVIGYGRYDLQAARWTDRFGADSMLVIRLEDYADRWHETAPKILEHLGLPTDVSTMSPPAKENATDQARVFTGTSRRVAENPVFRFVYRNGIRRVMSDEVRTKLRNTILPAPPERPTGPGRPVLAGLIDEFAPAVDYVARTTGTEPWDLAATIARMEDHEA